MSLNKQSENILPISHYLFIGITLIIFTIVIVLVAQFNFGEWNIILALAIAGFEASLVGLYFMKLRYDNRLFAIIFLSGILSIAIFISVILLDTFNRGELNPERRKIKNIAIIYDNNGAPIPMAQRAGLFERIEEKMPEKIPFELTHGYGPIKAEINVGPLDTAMALKGQPIFNTKCATCHKLDERYTGPPLRSVTVYRSPTFIMNQILDPRQNVDNHPEMKALLAQYYTYMTFQNVTQDEARLIIEYLRYEATRNPGDK